jgi:methionyl-tRNA formyltransferase
MKIVFMGTPPFAVPSLRQLATSRHEVVAVLTNPDRRQGRGRKAAPPAVKVAALDLGLGLIQHHDLLSTELAAQLASLQPDLFAVVAFSILPDHLLAIPRLGAINLHPSLLPRYRGAAPIIWAVINGETTTGITTFYLNSRVDAGDLLMQGTVAIDPDETAGELERRLSARGARLLAATADGIAAGQLTPRRQTGRASPRAPKLKKEDGRIDWDRPAETVRNHIRGTNPVPGAFTEWQGRPLKIHRARRVEPAASAAPGSALEADPRVGLVVAAADGALLLQEVQPAGKGPMEGTAFVRGYGITTGAIFE